MKSFLSVLLCAAAFAVPPAFANDSTAELGTGGLILSRSDAVTMASEDLFISEDKVTVDYVFHNDTDKDVSTVVAFPMPDIAGSPEEEPAIPDDQSDNFLGFTVTVDGKAQTPGLDQRAVAVGIDITDELKAHNVPLFPFGDASKKAVAALPADLIAQWIDRGIVIPDSYDEGSGQKTDYIPFWSLRSTYWWQMTFPAGKDVHVSHRYKPSVGGTSGVNFYFEGKFQGDSYADYKGRYCMDSAFEHAVAKSAKDGTAPYFENRIAYVLTSGGNWANGTIGKFHLTVDKGDTANLISFCGDNVKKTGPTRFEVTATDFYPEKDINVLILKPSNEQGGTDPAAQPAAGKGG